MTSEYEEEKYIWSLNPQHGKVKSRKKKRKKDVYNPESYKVGSQQKQMQAGYRVACRNYIDVEIEVMLMDGRVFIERYDPVANVGYVLFEKEQHE